MKIKEIRNRIREVINKEVTIYDRYGREVIIGEFINVYYRKKFKGFKIYFYSYYGLQSVYVKYYYIDRIEEIGVK